MKTRAGRRTREGLERLHEAVDEMQKLLQEHANTLLEIRPRILETTLSHADKGRLEDVMDDIEAGDLGLIWKEVVGRLREAIDRVDE